MSIIGKKAPAFSGEAAKNGDITTIGLDDYQGRWLVMVFYPLDFTFVCPTELVAFDSAREQFAAAGADLLGVSVDSVHTHLAWMRTPRNEAGVGSLGYPLLSDLDKSISAAFDVLSGDVSLRGVFIIDPTGTVQAATINNLPIGRNVSEVLRTLKAAQFVSTSGLVCPANWQEGDTGMEISLDGVKSVIS